MWYEWDQNPGPEWPFWLMLGLVVGMAMFIVWSTK